MVLYKTLIFNPLQVNCVLVYDASGAALIFDPGCVTQEEQKVLSAFISDQGLRPEAVIATHGHFDHLLGVHFVQQKFGIPFWGHHEEEALIGFAAEQARSFGFPFEGGAPKLDGHLVPGEELVIGQIRFDVRHVPGHSAGSLAFYSPDAGVVISGDVLFRGSIGRTDLPGGDFDTLLGSIREQLLTLPPDTKVIPGHGQETTIKQEAAGNPFLV